MRALTAPRVSIVLPCYNHGAFLAEAVASVVAQTCPDWELLIVDNGSTDESGAIARQQTSVVPDKRCRVLHKAHGHFAEGVNLGVQQARGAWIALLCADDVYDPTFLEAHLARATDDVNLVACPPRFFGRYTGQWTPPAFTAETIRDRNCFPIGALYRKALWQAAGGYPACAYSDWGFWMRCARVGIQPAYVAEALYGYRQHEGNDHAVIYARHEDHAREARAAAPEVA